MEKMVAIKDYRWIAFSFGSRDRHCQKDLFGYLFYDMKWNENWKRRSKLDRMKKKMKKKVNRKIDVVDEEKPKKKKWLWLKTLVIQDR